MRAIVTTPKTRIKLNGITCRAIAVLGALGKSRVPLRVPQIIEGMIEYGVLPTSQKEESEVSGILARLLRAGAVYHPAVPAGTRQYCLADGVSIHVECD